MRTFILGLAAVTMLAPAMAAPAFAKNDQRYDRYYDRDGYYSGPTWRGSDGLDPRTCSFSAFIAAPICL